MFVVETKRLDGQIYAGERDKFWKQVVNGREVEFQNPLHQNYRHKMAVARVLGVDPDFVHSAVVFVSEEDRFQTKVPRGVFRSPRRLSLYIQSFGYKVFSEEERREFEFQLHCLKETQVPNSEHEENVRRQLEEQAEKVCPRCGSELVERRAKRGVYEGRWFLGCKGFPECRYIRDIKGAG